MLRVLDRGYKDHIGRAIVGKMPIANMGDKGTYWVDYEVYFGSYLSFDFSISITEGSSTYQLNGANWSDLGISSGDNLFLEGLTDIEGNSLTDRSHIINLVNGSEAVLDTGGAGHSRMYVGGQIYVIKAPQAIKSKLNLIQKEQDEGVESLIDATSLTLTNDSIGTMSVSDILPLDLIGNKSGGGIIGAIIERLPDTKGGNAKSYRVEVEFYWWLYLSEYSDLFFDSDCVTPYIWSSFLPVWNNPSVSLTAGFKPEGDGNSGFRDENFNQNPNNFKVTSMIWSDGTNQIAGFDYSKLNEFEIKIESVIGNGFGDLVGLIMFNDIEDQDEYSASQSNNNGDFSHLRHTIFSEFANIQTTSTGNTFSSFEGVNGELLDFVVDSTLIGGVLTLSGTIEPNTEFKQTFSNPNNINKDFVLKARVESETFTASNYSDTVNLLAWKGTAENYPPILGGYFDSAELRDHANNLIQIY